jgi:outer membrane protein TolC
LNLIYILALGLNLHAADKTLSLSQAVSEGLSQSPVVQMAQSSAREAHWKKMEGWQMFLPTVTASGQQTTQQNYIYQNVILGGANVAVPQIVPQYMFVLSAKLPLFNGFVSTNQFQAASLSEEAAKQDSSWAEFKLAREISLQFYKAFGAKVLLEAAQQNLKTFEDHLKDIQDFKRAGISTNYDLLRVEVQTSMARTELLSAQDALQIERGRLTELLGLDSDERTLDGQLVEVSPQWISALDKDSFSERKDIISIQEKVEAAQGLEKSASRFWIPEISAFGNYYDYNNLNYNFPDSSSFRDAYQIGFLLTWNLFDGLGSYSRSKEAIEKRFQAEKSLRATQLHAKQDLDLWKRKYLYFCSVYKSRLEDIRKSTESVRLAREGRRVGARTNTELLDAEHELYASRASAVTSQLGAIEALINLEMTTGKTLFK